MKRYGSGLKKNNSNKNELDNDNKELDGKKLNQINLNREQIIQTIEEFKKRLSDIKFDNGDKLIIDITDDTILFNPKYSIDDINNQFELEVENKIDFIRNIYSYGIDEIYKTLFGEDVVVVHEIPYSFNMGKNEDTINYEFLI